MLKYVGVAAVLVLGAMIIFQNFRVQPEPVAAPAREEVREAAEERVPSAREQAHERTGATLVFGAIPYWDQARATAMFKKHVEDIDAVALFWYRLNRDGSIGKYQNAREDQSLIEFAHQHGVAVYALVANLPESGDWDRERVAAAIGTPEARAAHIQSLVALAREKNFDGINIDYEFLSDAQTDDFTTFINELGAALRAEGKKLKVAIHAQRPGSETRGQDIAALTGADYLAFMTYDQHWETSDPGANAEIGWTREVLEHAARLGVPMNKILLGIPLDGYNWRGEDGDWEEAEGVDYVSALELADAEGATVRYDESVEAPYFTFGNSDGSENEVWFENVQSFRPKYELAKEFGLAGVALWKFGAEDERIYDVIE
ncbi:MAG TPA: glycosyl hydrolase family 18 protein [Candidatus Paceibacterota bacterium]|nr:glycosyl hydrolase family 18 protein [Candidatus Paceibacterota bacterium]